VGMSGKQLGKGESVFLLLLYNLLIQESVYVTGKSQGSVRQHLFNNARQHTAVGRWAGGGGRGGALAVARSACLAVFRRGSSSFISCFLSSSVLSSFFLL
jgi:hypothetical protein